MPLSDEEITGLRRYVVQGASWANGEANLEERSAAVATATGLFDALVAELREAREKQCHHGWRGSAESEQVQSRCPSCGGQVFLGEGGHLTCASLPCPNPDAGEVWESAARENARLRAELAAGAANYIVCEDTGLPANERGECPAHVADACLFSYERIRERCLHFQSAEETLRAELAAKAEDGERLDFLEAARTLVVTVNEKSTVYTLGMPGDAEDADLRAAIDLARQSAQENDTPPERGEGE